MELELLMRRDSVLPPEVQQELEDAKLIHGENFDPEQYLSQNNLFSYDPFTFNVDDTCFYNRYDDAHTHICLNTGLSFIAKIDYTVFQRIKTAMTGQAVKTLNDFKLLK